MQTWVLVSRTVCISRTFHTKGETLSLAQNSISDQSSSFANHLTRFLLSNSSPPPSRRPRRSLPPPPRPRPPPRLRRRRPPPRVARPPPPPRPVRPPPPPRPRRRRNGQYGRRIRDAGERRTPPIDNTTRRVRPRLGMGSARCHQSASLPRPAIILITIN